MSGNSSFNSRTISAKVIAVWNGEKSGTKNTVDYANKCGVELVNIYKHEG